MPADPQRIQSAFLAAVAVGPDSRTDVLDRACGHDAELRGRVEALLRAHDRPEDTSAVGPGAWLEEADLPAEPAEGPGTHVGPYRLLQQLGEGGMGAVFMAEQTEPVRRLVAVKVIKAGMDSKQVVARFEAERQALALMDHPHIAKVLDAGTTRAGRPYFVMELVKGVPITMYCDEQHLSVRQRLELMVPVCQAVQHAHQKGIIHRDLKPSNVLVTLYDGKPVPKIIDFGVAKATGQRLTERTLFTGFGGIVGTFEYMAPEQAEFYALDVDTRSDIYSLGVLLYELLTGTTPLSRKRLQEASMTEVLRLIREEEAPRPSARLSQSKECLEAVSAQRHMERAALVRAVRGELDWLVMKALEKDRTRRYETANGLERDIQRYLADEPVEACPPSAGYRLRKLARRHRHGLAAAAAFVLLLAAGAGVSAWQAVRATSAEAHAVAERDQKEQARREAEARATEARAASELAQRRLEQIQKANALLGDIFQDANPRDLKVRGEGDELPELRRQLSRRLEAAADRLNQTVIDDPATLAHLQETLGRSLTYLGQPQRAAALLREAVRAREALDGRDGPATLQTMIELTEAYRAAGQAEKALPVAEEVLARAKARFGADHPNLLAVRNSLGLTYNMVGRPEEALPLFRELVAKHKASLGVNHRNTLANMHNLGATYVHARQLDQAVPLLEETLARREAVHGPDHFVTTRTRGWLAEAYLLSGRRDKAIPLLQQVLRQRERTLGPDHPETLTALRQLAFTYREAGLAEQAAPLLAQAAEKARKLGGEGRPARGADKAPPASRACAEARERYERAAKDKGAEHPEALEAWDKYAWALGAGGRPAEAATEYRRLLAAGLRAFRAGNGRAEQWAIDYCQFVANTGHADAEATASARAILGDGDTRLAPCAAALTARAFGLLARRKPAEAEPDLRECLAIRARQTPDNWGTFYVRSMLGEALMGQKKYAEAEPLLLEGYRGLKERSKAIPPQGRDRLREALERLVRLYEATGKPDEAARWRAELVQAKQ
jgi:serine/threonine protein kinase